MNTDGKMDAVPHFLDLPRGSRFERGLPIISGWYATDRDVAVEKTRLLMHDGRSLPYRATRRPDVEALYGSGCRAFGFTTLLDREYWSGEQIHIQIQIDGAEPEEMEIAIAPAAGQAMEAAVAARAIKRQWCMQHARCPACKARPLESGSGLRCPRCGTVYPQETSALNLMTPEAYRACAPREAQATSANPYGSTVLDVIDQIRHSDGMALDCGAGLRPEPNERVVNLEIGDYPSTDVLAVGQALPFQDAVFDAVFSLTVLEHVADPFACARELVRVLKPGGRLFVEVPFLQPEHGYPHHFFNMTREGVRTLFPDMLVEEHAVPAFGRPLMTIHWIMQQYAGHLSDAARERFLNMTARELLSKPPAEYLGDSIYTDMSDEGNWILASSTRLSLRK